MKHTIPKAVMATVALMVLGVGLAYAAEPLPSWNDGAAKKAILELER